MKNKTIVITGSTRGIGRELTVEFLKRGHQVVINGRLKENVEQAVNELKQIDVGVVGVAGNITDKATHQKIIREATSAFGKIDIWINNAGIPQPHKLFLDLNDHDLKKVTETNIFGLMLGTKTAAGFMTAQGFGKIFNMAGFGSNGRTMNKLTLYGTTKCAVSYFTKSFAKEIKGSVLQTGILNPGMVRTGFLRQSIEIGSISPEESKKFKKVYDVLAEDVDVVSGFLANRILKSNKDYDRIRFLTPSRLVIKLVKMALR